MDINNATEVAYKNGYEAGYKTGYEVGKLEAEKKAAEREEYRRLKEKYYPKGGEDA